MLKWEYCEVELRQYKEVTITIRYCRSTGSIVHGPEKVQNAEIGFERLKQIVAFLGLEGWELVNVHETGNNFWLKRPIEE